MEVLTTVAAWAASNVSYFPSVAETLGERSYSRAAIDVQELLGRLSSTAQVLMASDKGFAEASRRWNRFDEPKPGAVVIPGAASDVAATVQYANEYNTPFLAVSGQHGAASTLGKLQGGIEIAMSSLSNVELSQDGQTAKFGGGVLTKTVIDALWQAGKQTGKDTLCLFRHVLTMASHCLLGPGLGGGHGWLQGHYGLIADQFTSMEVVLADGSERTVDAQSDPDLWWALRGAGHNFAIVTSATLKVYDIQHRDWALDEMIFKGIKVEQVYQIIRDSITKDGKQDMDVVVWSLMMWVPDIDRESPIIIVYLLQQGVRVVNPKYTAAWKQVTALLVDQRAGTYLDLAAWLMMSMADPLCQKLRTSNIHYPLYLDTYDVGAVKKAYDMLADAGPGKPGSVLPILMFENYPVQGVCKSESNDSAFAFRNDGILAVARIKFDPDDRNLAGMGVMLGEGLRNTLHKASGRDTMHTYVNYAFRDSSEALYGVETWRQEKLAKLKARYDPHGRFNFYNPVA